MAHVPMPVRICLVLAALWTAAATAPSTETDSIIVKMESDPVAMETVGFSVQSAADADAAGALGKPIGRHLRCIKLQDGEQLQQRLERLRAMKGVKYAVPDLKIFPQRVQTADLMAVTSQQQVAETLAGLAARDSFKFQWGAGRVGLPDAWSIATGAASKARAVNLCVVDSGVDHKHPDLVANLVRGFSAVGGDDEERPNDEVGHGTTVHGVIAGSGARGGILGVNWGNINVLPCKFMSADGWGQTSDAIQCLDWCLAQKAAIISASWSCGELRNPPLEEAVARTKAAGVLVVVSAGNQGADMRKTPYYPQAYSAQYDNLLVVGATDEYDEHAFFSNHDPATVHMSAPGHWIYSTTVGGGYNFSSGTSIAAPFVSGSAALLLAVAQDKLGSSLTALELKAALMDSTERIDALKGRTATGGRLRTDWALQKLLGLELSRPMPCVARPGDQGKCSGEEKRHHGGKVQARSAAKQQARGQRRSRGIA